MSGIYLDEQADEGKAVDEDEKDEDGSVNESESEPEEFRFCTAKKKRQRLCKNPEFQKYLREQENEERRERVHTWTPPQPAGRPSLVKPPEFPKDVPVLEKLDSWLDWKLVLEASLELAQVEDQQAKANFLILTVGQEMRTMISMYSMKPQGAVDVYDKLVLNVENYLRRQTDPTANAAAFTSATQGRDENARDFEIRIRRMANRCEAGIPEDFVKSQFIKGMRNRALATQACVEALPMSEIVIRESRIESQVKQASYNPWNTEQEVAAVSVKKEFRADRFMRGERYERKRHSSGGPYQRPSWGQNDRQTKARGDCKQCGLKHRGDTCPAEGRECNKCSAVGHYGRMCRSNVNAVDARASNPQAREKVNAYDDE